MKKLIFTLLFLLSIQISYGTLYTVNNQEEPNEQQNLYASLQDAHDNAKNGDTIYVEGSPNIYGLLDVSKRLIIIGPGYYLAENENTQVVKSAAVTREIDFENGSQGSKLIGISVSAYSTSDVNIYVSNIEIKQCYLHGHIGLFEGGLENIIISQNYFRSSNGESINWYSSRTPAKNLLVKNNIINRVLILQNGVSGKVINNVIKGSSFKVGVNSSLEIKNNIILSTVKDDVILPPLPDAAISHNIGALDYFGSDNGNQMNVAETEIFVAQGTSDGQWQIKEGGPADGKGENGVDIGAFGGPTPYKLSGLPSIPTIYELSTSGFGNSESGLPITIKVKAN